MEINGSSSVNCFMYWIRSAEYYASFCIDYRCFLFPLLERAEVLPLLFRRGNVACQFEKLWPSGHTQEQTDVISTFPRSILVCNTTPKHIPLSVMALFPSHNCPSPNHQLLCISKTAVSFAWDSGFISSL